jgi:hypothetical protein
MSHELICTWLGLPPDGWPPDHYRLLGLEPGPADRELIERRVQERLETVRRYQLTHPEPATEAMNRLAQAFVCLTNAEARNAYDADLRSVSAEGAKEVAAVAVEVVASPEPARWSPELLPPPVRAVPSAPAVPTEVVWAAPATVLEPVGAPPAEAPASGNGPLPNSPPDAVLARAETNGQAGALNPTPPPGNILDWPALTEPERTEPAIETAQTAARARRGLGTKQALYHRVAQTRKLLRAWEQAGRYLANPLRRLQRPAEATHLMRQLRTIRELLRGFPRLLGQAGQPGYLVVALSRQQVVVPTFASLLPSQREALARDWKAGHHLLTAHRQFLRAELRAMRRKSPWRWGVRAVRAFINDHPGLVLLILGALALLVAYWRSLLTK